MYLQECWVRADKTTQQFFARIFSTKGPRLEYFFPSVTQVLMIEETRCAAQAGQPLLVVLGKVTAYNQFFTSLTPISVVTAFQLLLTEILLAAF